ncbi:MAG TPA: YigZ family protein [Wenzhouxiangella sp.]|nr:YigZ family protein [Wenzhouxiangella sp.]
MKLRLLSEVRHEAEIKKSRFIALAAAAESEEQAQDFIDRVSLPDATHNCWAWRIGERYRFDDAGEPGGTAGRPILQAIDGQGFDQTVVVVIRYFGGTKLGTGGLIRAYGGVTAEALRTAESTPIIPQAQLAVSLPFAYTDAAHHALSEFGGTKLDEAYSSSGVRLVVEIAKTKRADFVNYLRNLARGEITVEDG